MWYDKPTPLGQKLTANQQRRRREGYLAALAHDLRATLSAAPFATSPAADDLAQRWAGSTDDRPWDISGEYTRRTFAGPERLFSAIDAYGVGVDARRAYFRPDAESPVYEVPFGWARRNMRRLVGEDPSGVVLVTSDVAGGFVVWQYCGYLNDDFNPTETVYVLASWQPSAAG